MQGGSPSDYRMLHWINGALRVDPGYVCVHHEMMQANWHQYIECTSIQVGMLNNT